MNSNAIAKSGVEMKLITFLNQRDSYPHNPEYVEHIQTHISHVFLAPPFVYKIKKPVDFGFLDYSSLDKRKKYCRREIELNRRLSDDVYLGVVFITKENGGFAISENEPEEEAVVEYAVKMKQLPEKYLLHRYLENDALSQHHLDRLAGKLAVFYNTQQPDDEILKWGRIKNIKVNTDENFSQTKSFIGKTIDRNSFAAIKYFTRTYFEKHPALFKRRVEEKRIVDGHGDLHLEHIHITPEKVQIYDCIEFNKRFRYGDVAADLAYLAMDLDFNNCRQMERYFISRMAEKLDDPKLPKILDFYKCYRAYVKGKVKSLQSSEEEVPENEQKQAAGLASCYFNLSLRYALLGSGPVVMAFMGRVGTGKSTLARHLKNKLNVGYYSTDRIRKSLAGLPLKKRTPADEREELYSGRMSGKSYGILLDKAAALLESGESVILDATFSSASSRRLVVKMAEAKQNARLFFIETQASDKTIKQRLKNREDQQDVISDARLEDFEMLDSRYRVPTEIKAAQRITIKTDGELEDTVKRLYLEVAERNVESQNSVEN